MGVADFVKVTARSTVSNGPRAGARTFARELWHSWQRLYRNGEIVHRLKWYLPHGDPVLNARCYEAEIPASNFSEYHVADVFEERYLVHDFLRFVGPNDVFWDVGANVGLWTLLVAQAAGETVAFEPDRRVMPHLQKSIKHNGLHVRTLEVALGDDRARVEMEVNHRWGTDPISVPVRRGDALIDNGMPAPDVMKVDVEGAELAALEGMGEYLGDVRHLLVEVHPQRIDHDPQAIVDLLEQTHTVEIVNQRGMEFHVEARRRT